MKKAARRAAREARLGRRFPRDPGSYVPPPPTSSENRDSCDMRERDPGFDFHGPDAKPGDFAICPTEAKNGTVYFLMWHKLPDGSVGAIPLDPVPECARETWTHGNPPRLHTWRWDGNREKPTLTPSVHAVGRWHGWFRAGRMVSC